MRDSNPGMHFGTAWETLSLTIWLQDSSIFSMASVVTRTYLAITQQ